MNIKHRDVHIITLNEDELLVTACDSCGGIGEKPGDMVNASTSLVARMTARVCLMEVFSVNATPIGMAVNICNEPNPTGEKIIEGIKEEIYAVGIDIPMTISTEKNFDTSMTAMGITVYGKVNKNKLLLNKVRRGNNIYSIGIPAVGDKVVQNQDIICSTKDIIDFLKDENIVEIIPVGSSGVKGEINKLQMDTGFNVDYEKNISIDLNSSAGPACVAIIITDKLWNYPSDNRVINKIGVII